MELKINFNFQDVSPVFSSGAGEYLAKKYDVPLLACLPLDPKLAAAQDGYNIQRLDSDSPVVAILRKVMAKLSDFKCNVAN